MKLFNTLTRSKQDFSPIYNKTVGIYSCGPTVYNSPTIGNLRAYIFTDILKKTLRHVGGWDILDVVNTTDVGHLQSDADEGEDKMDISAKRTQTTPEQIAKKFTDEFLAATDALNITRPKVIAPATSYINQMIKHVLELEQLGFTYNTSDGVYFRADKFDDYFALRGKSKGDKAGMRVSMGEKQNQNDFCLWRFTKPTALQKFESPWGVGTPGWHIECSAIAREHLGDQFDIHTGGVDHIPIHHTNERAQTQAITKKEMSRFWLHNEFVKVDGTKMSKSLGNVYTLSDLIAIGYDPLHFRYLCLLAHYRTILNFTFDGLDAAKKAYENLVRELSKHKAAPKTKLDTAKFRDEFNGALSDDLNTPKAIGTLWTMLKSPASREIYDQAIEFDRILSLDLDSIKKPKEDKIPKEVMDLAILRAKHKQNRDFANADRLREQINALGFNVSDTPNGPGLTKQP